MNHIPNINAKETTPTWHTNVFGDLLDRGGDDYTGRTGYGTAEAEGDQGTAWSGFDLSRNHHRGRADRALRLQLGIEYIDLSKTTIPISMAQVVPKNIAKQFQVVPVRMERDELYLAMSDPMNFYAIEEVKKAVRKKIVPMIATTEGVEHASWSFTETKAPQGY